MADNILQTKIQLRYGTYTQWMNSNLILLQGEAAICSFPQDRTIEHLSNSKPDYTPPSIGIKIGDGTHYFRELPWVQAIAADVYTWAKSSIKPTYTAQEIQGLQSFVENLVGGDIEVNIAPRIYQLVQGTGDNVNKYYLQYKENNSENNWIIDTTTYIDLENLQKIVSWIGQANLNDYPTLITRTAEQIRYFLGTLAQVDNAVTNQFVTSVSEINGIINVTRAQPTFSNLSGSATVSQGGTGLTTLTEDSVLVGNGTNAVKLVPIAESIENNNYLVTNRLVKSYVDNATAGLTGAMHFIGDAGVTIRENSAVNPNINGYDFSKAQPGDVVLSEQKEFVWTGGTWRLLGDEGSYAIKGSIVDADIDAEAEIAQSKIANLSETFDTKVDKVEGKVLSSNDFTNEFKNKLDGIDEGAQRNIIEHILVNGSEVRPSTIEQVPNSVNLQISEFGENAQLKLAGIAAGAEVNKVEKIVFDGTEVTPDANKVITLTSNPHTEHENKIEQIFINDREQTIINKQVRITIDQEALNLNVVAGAQIPKEDNSGFDEIMQVQKKLQFERIATTADVKDLKQNYNNTYIILDCGTSDNDMHPTN